MARVINTGPGDTGAKVAGTAQKRQTRSTTAETAQATAGPSTGKVPTTGKQAAQPASSVAGPSTAKVAVPTAAKNNGKPKRGRPRTACSPCRRAKKPCPHMRKEEEEEEEEDDDDDQKKLSEKAKGKQKMKRADDDDGDDGDGNQKQLSEKAKGKQKRKRADDDDDDDDNAPGPIQVKKRGRPAKNQAAIAEPSTVPRTVAGPSGSAPAPAAPANLSNPLTAAGHIVTHQYMSQQLGQRLDEAEKRWTEAMDAMMKAKQALDAWKDFYLKHKGSPS
ncbi:hypothetical protein ASPACDRAFT_59057 [Aspergillus aculeatus ATCC 16872]|uniref:Uncharacterized protein n=1 Tax=Aspergillus aculeatus (strain ATCC 16872 / CBS 172.66 / WB 5094) TaxID=690307 RepID=A0A1L9WZP4_ASPA1|nr:uncharacterized protein ASPACDRAFT_59057 [Aspergillus aculeatus ATCC 16872]OJK01348.1 hypothetical protein ASPACDRAFT_59057 [Aspergillus aculeatus ATCC 16872]